MHRWARPGCIANIGAVRSKDSAVGLSFLRLNARPPVATLVAYIDDHKQVFGVEPIYRVLSEHGMPIAPSTYYEARNRAPSRRAVREEQLKAEVARAHQANYGVYGARKIWLQLHREDIAVAHCTVRRLMRELGLSGARRGKKKRTTIADPQAARATDLVQRKFDPAAPNQLWVADLPPQAGGAPSYVSNWSGWVYVAFVIDAYSRRVVGWRTATSMNTQLVLDAIEHAIWTRAREGVTDLTGLIHHHDRGSQYTSIAFTERLRDAGIDASIGATGNSYDNALAQTINGLYKTELIKPRGPWRTADHVEIDTLNGSTGSTTDASTNTAATSHQQSSKPPTTVTTEPSNPPSSQTKNPPDTPSGVNPDAFAEPATADQERLLRSSVAEDITFSNPGVNGQGLDSLLAATA